MTVTTPAVVFVDAAEVDHLETLARQAMERSPAVAHRLLDELARASIVDGADLPADVVTIGSRVTFRNESSGSEQTVTLVYPEHADLAQGRVSVMTPIGVSLLGLRRGGRFSWDSRASASNHLTVLEVDGP